MRGVKHRTASVPPILFQLKILFYLSLIVSPDGLVLLNTFFVHVGVDVHQEARPEDSLRHGDVHLEGLDFLTIFRRTNSVGTSDFLFLIREVFVLQSIFQIIEES